MLLFTRFDILYGRFCLMVLFSSSKRHLPYCVLNLFSVQLDVWSCNKLQPLYLYKHPPTYHGLRGWRILPQVNLLQDPSHRFWILLEPKNLGVVYLVQRTTIEGLVCTFSKVA